jgi:hypothetical protein
VAKRNRSQEIIDLLAAELPVDDEYTIPERGTGAAAAPAVAWYPPLGPVGMLAFHCQRKFMLLHGPRFSGKTMIGVHKVIKHLYDNDGAKACLVTLTRSQATLGGLWEKFQSALNVWADGLGLEGEGKNGEFIFKQDDARNRYVWIKNAHGGWSMAFLRSMMHGDQIAARVKSMEFTIYLYDELSDTDDPQYFTKPIQQLWRIPHVAMDQQQFIGCCNPSEDGEDNWVHKQFLQGFDNPNDRHPKSSKDYGVYFVPIEENIFVSREQMDIYRATLLEECRNDPTAFDRLLKGLWIKRPTGKGLFAEYFRREIHVRGDVGKKQFIIPSGSVIDIGYDIGSANTGIVFEERLNTKRGELWSWFDEIILVEKYVPIPQVAPMLLAKMNYWCGRTNRRLHFNHIADASSFDQMRPDGTYDARVLERECAKELKENPERYPHLVHVIYVNPDAPEAEREFREKPVRLIPCPKPDGSVMSRVKMTISRLQAELIVASARCFKCIEMLESIEQDPEKPYHPKKGSRHKHALDAGTYVIYHYEMGGRGAKLQTGGETRLTTLHT